MKLTVATVYSSTVQCSTYVLRHSSVTVLIYVIKVKAYEYTVTLIQYSLMTHTADIFAYITIYEDSITIYV